MGKSRSSISGWVEAQLSQSDGSQVQTQTIPKIHPGRDIVGSGQERGETSTEGHCLTEHRLDWTVKT